MRRLICASLLSYCGTATAHVGDAWPLTWSLDAWVLGSLAISAALYALGLVRLWRSAGAGRGIGRIEVGCFTAGWAALAVALVSPIDPLGNRLFAAHMVQHELLVVVAAPLMVLGRPLGTWAWALAPTWRRILGRGLRHPLWRLPWQAISAPLAAWWLHAAALWLWHAPVLFDAALRDDAVHAWQHASFLTSGLLFWWSVLGPATRAAHGKAMASLFTTLLHTGALGALLALSPRVWYAGYTETTTSLGIAALYDQQLGGLLMWVPGGLTYLAAALFLAARWMGPAPMRMSREGHSPIEL
jgi:putative membrane protein